MAVEMEVQVLRQRVSKLEAEVRFLYKHLGVTYEPEPFAIDPADVGVVESLKKGDEIGAIKVYRAVHGVGLNEAKEAVDEIKAALGV